MTMTKITTSPAGQRGRSIIELMIVLVISMIVMGAVLLTVSGSSITGEQQDAQARMNEDAAVAASLMSWHLRQGGYSVPTHIVAASSTPDRSYFSGPPVRGCENGMQNARVADWSLIGCNAAGANSSPDALAVMYEATTDNTTPSATNRPTDCVGFAIDATRPSDVDGTPYRLAENRYFINTVNGVTSLYCIGSGGAGTFAYEPQPLIPNVVDMQITYGVAALAPAAMLNQPLFRAVSFLRADQIDLLPGTTAADRWRRVVSIRVCLLMQSDEGALSQSMGPYTNCRGQVITPAANDRRLYRAVNVVVSLRNRIAPCVNTANAAQPIPSDSLCT